METKNGENRSPKSSKQSKDSQLKAGVGSVGSFSRVSPEDGTNKITASREDSNESDTAIARQHPDDGISGKIVGQLIEENEKQLAYHQQQIELINARIQELKRIPEKLTE